MIPLNVNLRRFIVKVYLLLESDGNLGGNYDKT